MLFPSMVMDFVRLFVRLQLESSSIGGNNGYIGACMHVLFVQVIRNVINFGKYSLAKFAYFVYVCHIMCGNCCHF